MAPVLSDLANLVCRGQHIEHHTAKYLDTKRQQEFNVCLLSHKDTSITHTHARTNTLIRSGRILESWSLLVVNSCPTASHRTETRSHSVTTHAPTPPAIGDGRNSVKLLSHKN
jgi:hypothetical protein